MVAHSVVRFSRLAWLAIPVLVLAACADAPAPLAPDPAATAAKAPSQPVRLAFSKCIADADHFVWAGTVTGDIEGGLTTALTDLRVAGPIWHVRFDWIVAAGDESFVADLGGILNTRTGSVVMNGRVADGHLAGAQVHEEGQLVDPEALCFEGSIRIMPATAR